MQKWEYKVVTDDGIKWYEDGRVIVQSDSLFTYLNKLGDVGWELVAITPYMGDGSNPTRSFVFKRPKP